MGSHKNPEPPVIPDAQDITRSIKEAIYFIDAARGVIQEAVEQLEATDLYKVGNISTLNLADELGGLDAAAESWVWDLEKQIGREVLNG